MIELCKYIYNSYPNLKNKVEYWQVLSLLDKCEDRIITVKDGNKIKGSALYAKVSDETLWQIENGFLDLTNPVDSRKVLTDTGDNIHFIYLLADSQKTILKGLREVIKKENPKTVSWFNPEMNKFNKFIIKRS